MFLWIYIEKNVRKQLRNLTKLPPQIRRQVSTGQKTYWKIVNNLLNKCNVPRIPPLLTADKFIINCKEKAVLSNNFFVAQCQPLRNTSVLPNFHFLTPAKLATCEITTESILNILTGLNANKAHGPDDISVKMIKLCPNALCAPLNLIFNNILATGIYPDQWKMANVTPIHKKDNKQVINNYRPISLLPIFAKIVGKLYLRTYIITLLVIILLLITNPDLDRVIRLLIS